MWDCYGVGSVRPGNGMGGFGVGGESDIPGTASPGSETLGVVNGVAKVAIACCRATDTADPGDLFPDPDSEILVGSLARIGIRARMVAWDDPTVAWETMDSVVVRSTWDSVDRPAEYLRWARLVDRISTLVNPTDVLAWNLDKATYLEDLARDGIPVVPTQFVRAGSDWTVEGEVVVKPAISAGGRETARYRPGQHVDAETHVRRLVDRGHTVMIQPYLPAVDDPGELSLVFVAGSFTHAVRKGPVLEAGAGVVDRPWERMTLLGLTHPSPAELGVARQVQMNIEGRFGPLVYSRVDLIGGHAGEPQVVEVELIDPNLSLALCPIAADRLSAAIKDQLVAHTPASQRPVPRR